MTKMDPAQLNAFLRETRIAKLATLNADGSPNVVPVWFEWDGTVARVFTGKDSSKLKRIARDPRVALSVEEGVGIEEAWATIEGTATVAPEGAVALIERLTPRYYAPGKAETTLKEWLAMEGYWVTITITPRRIRSS